MVVLASQGSAITSSDALASLNANHISAKIVPNILICIPAFNEARTIGRIVSRSKTYGTRIVVCDDGSDDDTFTEAAKSGAIVTTHRRNMGKGAALKTLLQAASRLHPDVVVTLDGDGQHDPTDIPLLIGPVLDGTADVVIGCRFNDGNHVPFYRRLGNSILTFMTNWSAGTNVKDTQSGFRAYAPNVIPSISISERGMGVDSEILIQLARRGFRIGERNITVSYGGDTSTLNPVSHIIRVVWSIFLGRYRSLKIIPAIGWTVAFGTLITTLVLVGLFKAPFSWMGLGASILAFAAGVLAIALGPNGRFTRWIRKGRATRL